jgi:hypothetical protein
VVVHEYVASQEDELGLKVGELVDILRKLDDGKYFTRYITLDLNVIIPLGWYNGEIVSKDGIIRTGWFPSSYVQQVMNDHVLANKYRQKLEFQQVFVEIYY